MPTGLECVCCREIPEVNTRIQEEEDDEQTKITCITEHSGFSPICINRHTLRTAYFAYRDRYGDRNDAIHERYRYVGYRQFVRWCWGHLGKNILVVLPACVVTKIRSNYPNDDGKYKGNKLAQQNLR